MDVKIKGLRFPLVALVQYCGMTLVAMTLLPIDNTTHVYGSNDGGKTLRFDESGSVELCKELGQKLNLKPHHPKNHPEISVSTCIDLEVHLAKDGNYYALDFSRLMVSAIFFYLEKK